MKFQPNFVGGNELIIEYALLAIISFFAGGLTLFSGFGLSTLLLPVFIIFMSPSVAVQATALVHFINNFYKLFIFFRKINFKILYRFGIPALLSSILGALFLNYLSTNERNLKVVLGIIIVSIALLEMWPRVKNLKINIKWAPLGGLISGFFGGLSGHQGLFRSAFLIKSGLSKDVFIATGIGIAVLVDITRLTIYGSTTFTTEIISSDALIAPIALATISALFGVSLATDFVTKMTIKIIQNLVSIMILMIGLLLIIGII